MGAISPLHLIIVLVIAVLVLGPGKLPEVGAALGGAMKSMRDAMEGKEPADPADGTAAAPIAAASVAAAPVAAASVTAPAVAAPAVAAPAVAAEPVPTAPFIPAVAAEVAATVPAEPATIA